METTCRIVVDASGRKTMVGNQMKWRIQDKVFNQYAIHTWFDGYDRRCMASNKQTQGDFIFIHFLPITNTWVWQIPINETVTSIGVVTQKQNFAKAKEDREKFFWECIKSRPELYEGLRAQGSEQCKPFKEEGDYSYAMKQIVGDAHSVNRRRCPLRRSDLLNRRQHCAQLLPLCSQGHTEVARNRQLQP